MAIKPILFNTEMVRAILDGRKTCTRRIVKPQPTAHYGAQCIKPPYQPGDILYVRETWGYPIALNSDEQYVFRADEVAESGFKNDSHIWYPSIHMPKEAARIWLKVTDVKVERLQEITPQGAWKEGARCACLHPVPDCAGNKTNFANIWNSTIKKSDLDQYGWEVNPYVFVIEFERCKKPNDKA